MGNKQKIPTCRAWCSMCNCFHPYMRFHNHEDAPLVNDPHTLSDLIIEERVGNDYEGASIYYGDIVVCGNEVYPVTQHISGVGYMWGPHANHFASTRGVVIGNIHENPELEQS